MQTHSLAARVVGGFTALVFLAAAMIGANYLITDRVHSRAEFQTVAAPAAANTITLSASGDIMVHPPTWEQARADAAARGRTGYDFGPALAGIRPRISAADLGICHMEIPMGTGDPKDFPHFSAPTEVAAAIKRTGYDACSTASNHALDMGEAGLITTLNALDAAGVKHTGTFRTQKAAETPTIYTVNGVKVGHLSWAMHFNEDKGNRLPVGKPWMANKVSIPKILKAAHAARVAGAEIVVLSLHAGTEKVHEPDAEQVAWVNELVKSPDIDLILGHHAHVVQPVRKIGGKWVVYGMGNTLARHDFPDDDNRQGIIPTITFTRQPSGAWQVTRMEVTPIWLSLKPDIRVMDLPQSIASMAMLDRRRTSYIAQYEAVSRVVRSAGAQADGLVVTPYE